MSEPVDLRVLELLAARLCHDLISPVAAINNGVELLGDEDPDFAAEAVRLVGESARKASRRLQFLRFAYGFTGSGLAGPPPFQLVRELFVETAVICSYGEALRTAAIEQQKLACNLIALAGDALARGGTIAAELTGAGMAVQASGDGNGLPAEVQRALTLETPVPDLSSRSVGGYFAGLLARAQGWRLSTAGASGGFTLTAGPA